MSQRTHVTDDTNKFIWAMRHIGSTNLTSGAPNSRREQNAFESTISDIQMLKTQKKMRLSQDFSRFNT